MSQEKEKCSACQYHPITCQRDPETCEGPGAAAEGFREGYTMATGEEPESTPTTPQTPTPTKK